MKKPSEFNVQELKVSGICAWAAESYPESSEVRDAELVRCHGSCRPRWGRHLRGEHGRAVNLPR
eukprot:2442295-Pyramimonas_sp.AAC.1